MKNDPLDLKSLGLQNEKLVISLLRKHKAISQTQLRKLTGLSSSTTSYIIRRLRTKNWIIEAKGESTKRGAKPIVLQINPTGCYAIGAEISPDNILVGLFDFNAQLIDTVKSMLENDSSPENVCKKLEINIKGLIAKHNISQEKLAGIGVALSGSISASGSVELSSPLGWKNVPIGEKLNEVFDCHVKIFSTHVRIMAETNIQFENSNNNILYINIGNGVGSHAIIDGHLIRGKTGRSGEFGHMIMEPQGPHCGCGHRGCLEAFISGIAISKIIKSKISEEKNSQLAKSITMKDVPEDVIAKWGQCISSNDPLSLEIRDYIAKYLCRAACFAINLYDPDTVIIAGYVAEPCFDFLSNKLREQMKTDVYGYESRNITIRQAQAGKNALIIGSAREILQS